MARTRTGISTARTLRRRQTDSERVLWSRLRDRQLAGAKFRRQHAIGKHIADFACVEHGIVIELDGSQHMQQESEDAERTATLAAEGFRVLRFWDNDVLRETEAVLERILLEIEAPSPRPSAPSRGRGRESR